METYSFLRHFADSWLLLAMTVVFLGVCVWAFRPGSRAVHEEVGQLDLPQRRPSCGSDTPLTATKEART